MAAPEDTWDVDSLFQQHTDTCVELGSVKAELARLEASVLTQRAATFHQLNDGSRSITAIREEVTFATASTDTDRILLQGEADQLQASLRALEARIAYLPLREG